MKAPRRRKLKHQKLIDQFLSMEPGDYVDLEIPRDRSVTLERNKIARLIERHVRQVLPEYLFRSRLTENRKIRVSCHVRQRRGRLSQS